jgi:predicted PurR-regulated permease PerM
MYYRERLEFAIRNPFVKLFAFLVAFILFGWLVYHLRGVLTPVLISFLIAYLLDPLVDRLERRGLSRTLSILILLVLLFIAASAMLFFIALALRDLVDVIKNDLPRWLDHQVMPWLNGAALPWLSSTFDLHLERTGDVSMVRGAIAELRTHLTSLVPHLSSPARIVLTSALSGTMALLSWVASAIMIPLISFYLLRDFDRIIAKARSLIPRQFETEVVATAREIDTTLAAFLRGQFLVMMILGLLYGIGLSIARVKMGFGIGLLAGLLCFIPYLGFFIGIGMALIMSLLGGDNIWWNLLGTGITFGVVQALEGSVITPKIVGDKVGLHPVWVIVALLVGASLLGVLGMLLAIPLAAVLKIIIRKALVVYRKSLFFTREEADSSPQPSPEGSGGETSGTDDDEAPAEPASDEAPPNEAPAEASPPPPAPAPLAAPPEPEAPHPPAESPAPAPAGRGSGEGDVKAQGRSPKTLPLHTPPRDEVGGAGAAEAEKHGENGEGGDDEG